MSTMACRLASSVARGFSSTASRPIAAASSKWIRSGPTRTSNGGWCANTAIGRVASASIHAGPASSVRTARGPRHRPVAYLGKLPGLDPGERAGWEHIGEILDGKQQTESAKK